MSRVLKSVRSDVGSMPGNIQTPPFRFMKWTGENGKSVLEDIYGGQRNEGPHYVNFMDAKVAWPPPTETWTKPTASICWEATLPDDNSKGVNLEDFCTLVKADTAVMSRR